MRKNPYPGKFIVIEGIDGSGKSTQIEFIADWLHVQQGIDDIHILKTHEPTDHEFGTQIKEVLAFKKEAPVSHLALQELYIRDRKDHLLRDIIPHLQKEGNVVLCDRYALSTFAYTMANGTPYDVIMDLHEKIIGEDFIVPDIMFIIDIDPLVTSQRLITKLGDGNLDYFEKQQEFMKRVAKHFCELTKFFPDSHIISGDRLREEVSREIGNVLARKIKISYTS